MKASLLLAHASVVLLALLLPGACGFRGPAATSWLRPVGGRVPARGRALLVGSFEKRGAFFQGPRLWSSRSAGPRPSSVHDLRAAAAPPEGDGAEAAIGKIDAPDDAGAEKGPHLGPVPDIERSESLEMAGTPDALLELRERYLANRNVTATELASCFPFPLDEFQMEAVRALIGRRSVVVSAPTGSGKTVCGEAAVYLGVAMGKRVLYATPLKALSNQKYNDFCAQFGAERVGLLTGDVSINRANANIIVLTTEIYRNMLYDVQDGSVRDVHSVILDEFHYMNDKERGTVWEESVIYSPPEVLIVALSATMRNVKDIRDWFASVHGPTDLITSDYRPVPLGFKYLDRKGICELFDKEPNRKGLPRLNRRLLPDAFSGADGGRERRSYESGRSRRGGNGGRSDTRDGRSGGSERSGGTRTGSRWDEARMPPKGKSGRDGDAQGGRDKRSGGGGGGRRGGGGGMSEVPSFGFAVRQMQKRDLLPAIVFVFSRKGCDAAAEEVGEQRVSLVSADEKARIMDKLKTFSAKHKEVATEERIRLALRGIASHHAGMVPLWKSVVEELYQEGLIKVVFATETLAAGINMPARTTVITAMSKRSSDGVGSLTSNELRQMCGRAGRRGKDTVGHSIMMRSRWEGAPEAFTLVMQQPDPLTSKFAPNYAMVLNLLMDRPLDECREIVERSFGSFLAAKNKQRLEVAADANSELREQVEEAQDIVDRVDPEDLRVFQKLTERLKTEQRVARILTHQAQDNRKSMFEDMILYCQAGTPVLLKYTSADPYAAPDDMSSTETLKGSPESGIIVGAYDPSQVLDATTPDYVVCLTKSNRIRIVTASEVVEVDTESEAVSLGDDVTPESLIESLPNKRKWLRAGAESFVLPGTPVTQKIVDRIPELEPPGTPPEVLAQEDRVRHVEALLVAHPIFERADRKDLLRAARFLADKAATGELRALNSAGKKLATGQVEEDVPVAWADFLSCKQCLQDFGYVQDNVVTDVGKLIGSINSENPLWVGSVLLYSEELYDFGPHELAAALSCLVADMSRPDLYVAVEPSEKVSLFTMNALDMQTRVVAAQLSHGISFDVPLDASMAGLVEAWALGTPWSTILGLTSLQEGDIIRLLRRVLDLLRQIPRLPYVPGTRGVDAQLRLNARRALTIMDRFPVSDDVTYSIDEDEGLADDDTMALAEEMAAKREALVGKVAEQRRVAAELFGASSGWGEDEADGAGLLDVESQDVDNVWIGPLGETMQAGSEGASWASNSDGSWGSDDEEDEDEEDEDVDEAIGDDEAFIRSLGLGGNKEGLIGDFSL